jgi:hypothetical protein
MELTEEYIAQDLGIIPMDADVQLGEICAIRATNRQVLVDEINARIESGWIRAHPEASYLFVSLSCPDLGCPGCSAEYKTEADVPEHSVPCPCGNPNHWLIKYEEVNAD